MYTNFISSFILSFTIFCFVNLEVGEAFGILFWSNLELDCVWDIHDRSRYERNISWPCFLSFYTDWLASIILVEDIPLCLSIILKLDNIYTSSNTTIVYFINLIIKNCTIVYTGI